MGWRGVDSFAPLPLEGLLPSGVPFCCVALRWALRVAAVGCCVARRGSKTKVPWLYSGWFVDAFGDESTRVPPGDPSLSSFPVGVEGGAIGGVGPLGAPPGFLGCLG